MRHVFYIIFFLSFIFTSCFQKSSNQTSDQSTDSKNSETYSMSINNESLLTDKLSARIHTVHGDIILRFYPTKAPNTVKRIISLIQSGFYDGLTFHRVVPNFVIQGGDPTGTGQGGSGSHLKAEFSDLKHEIGTVAMARTSDPDSADSQFYIALGNLPHLDGKYTIFAKVVQGIEILEKISVGDKMLTFSLISNN